VFILWSKAGILTKHEMVRQKIEERKGKGEWDKDKKQMGER